MDRVIFIFREMLHLIRRHKIVFLAPPLFFFVLLAILAFVVGPAVITSFIYAGI